jgi:Ca2+-binding RTX toxin-like protein
VAIINVSSTASLTSALKAATGGDIIKLAPGTYSGLALSNLTYASDVTITSADPTKLAILTDFTLKGVNGLTFTNLEMATLDHTDLVAKGLGFWAFNVNQSSDIHFDHVKVHGSLDGDVSNDVRGIGILNSKDVSVTNSEFQQLDRALAIGETSQVTVSGNSAHDLRSDGFDFAQVSYVKLTSNTFSTFKPNATDHPDAIQFWTSGTTTASHDILISGNVILKGDGADTQGIFLRDQIGTLPYERVTISNNLIVGTGYNGIRIQGATDLTLTGNELISFAGENKTWILVQGADRVVATNNQATAISFDTSTHVTQSGNVINAFVTDKGAAAIQQWTADGGSEALVTSTVIAASTTTTTAPVNHDLAELVAGDKYDNLLQGFGGNDTLDGRGGADTLMGGAGDDVYYAPTALSVIVEKAGEGIDTVIARGEHFLAANVENLIISSDTDKGFRGWGNELDNRMTGNIGANQLDGAAGNDTLDGGAGNDTLIGGAGSDRLTGGAGDDVFRFLPGSGKDVITDFGAGPGQELLDIAAFLKVGLKPTITEVDGHAVISFTNGDSISLLGVHASDLGAVSKIGWLF